MPDPSWADFVAGFEIFRDPLLCATAAGLVLGFLGVFVVLRRMVFVTATLGQSAGLGVALAFYAEIHLGLAVSPVLAAIVLAIVAAGVFAFDPRKLRLSRESILGVSYITAGALVVMVGDRISQEAHEISAIVFGSAVLVRPDDMWLVLAVGGLIAAMHGVAHRGFVFASFDPEGARVQGVPVRVLDLALWGSLALMVAVATRALGVLPVFAFAVIPAMTALVFGLAMRPTLWVAAALGAIAAAGGYVAAFLWSFPVGATQAGVAAALFLVASLAQRVFARP